MMVFSWFCFLWNAEFEIWNGRSPRFERHSISNFSESARFRKRASMGVIPILHCAKLGVLISRELLRWRARPPPAGDKRISVAEYGTCFAKAVFRVSPLTPEGLVMHSPALRWCARDAAAMLWRCTIPTNGPPANIRHARTNDGRKRCSHAEVTSW